MGKRKNRPSQKKRKPFHGFTAPVTEQREFDEMNAQRRREAYGATVQPKVGLRFDRSVDGQTNADRL